MNDRRGLLCRVLDNRLNASVSGVVVPDDEYMKKDVAITLRIPFALKRQLAAIAKKSKRSVSSQVAHYIAAGIPLDEETVLPRKRLKLIGRFAGTRVPTDEDFREVRRLFSGLTARIGEDFDS